MPIIHNFSDKYKPRLLIITALYVLIPLALFLFLINFLKSENPQPEEMNNTLTKYICFEKDVEQYLVDKVDKWALDHEEYQTTEEGLTTECSVTINRNITDPNDLSRLFNTTYILVRKEGTTLSNITEDQFLSALITQEVGEYALIWDLTVDSFLRSNFDIGVGQAVYSKEEINRRLTGDTPYIAILPENSDLSGLRKIKIDNQAPGLSSYNSSRYPLIDRYWIGGSDQGDIEAVYDILVEQTGTEN